MQLGNESMSYEDRIAAMRRRFVEKLPARMERARELVEAASLPVSPGSDESAQHELHRLVHEVCGSSGMVGLPDIEAEARLALEIIEIADRDSTALTQKQRDTMHSAIARISRFADVDSSHT